MSENGSHGADGWLLEPAAVEAAAKHLFLFESAPTVGLWTDQADITRKRYLRKGVHLLRAVLSTKPTGTGVELPDDAYGWGVASKWGRKAFEKKEYADENLALHRRCGEEARLVRRTPASRPGEWEEVPD